jgi:type IV pilus assembly protein PilA
MDMKNKNKGFTLIELLVVVAIIGILAAVGTVAYTGYTAGAKKASSKSNHAAAVKYMAAEDQKCNVGADKAFGLVVDDSDAPAADTFACVGRTGSTIATAAIAALSDFKNPYSVENAAIRLNGAHAAKADLGYVNVSVSGDTLTLVTCFQDSTDDPASDSTCSVPAKDEVSNEIDVGE